MCSIEKESATLLPQNMVIKTAIVQHVKAILMGKLNAQVPSESFFFYQEPYTKFSFFSSKYKEYYNFEKQKNKKKKKKDSAPKFSQQNWGNEICLFLAISK